MFARRSRALWFSAIAVALATAVRGGMARAAQDALPNLPPDWKVVSSVTVPADKTAQIARKLGGAISQLTNTVLAFGQQRLQANVITCPAEADARAIHTALLKMHGNPAYCLRDGNKLVESLGTTSGWSSKRDTRRGSSQPRRPIA